ncbi:MAG: cyclic nucleotide-binding domain-containing protein [Burkholderiales bacterium]|nr:cyclic nucleotide-binding domain-containing protein [Burkholderiales bacterium]
MFAAESLAKLVSVARAVSYAAGDRLVRQGAPSRGAFLIGAGQAEARVALPGGGVHAVARFGAGELFGEAALIERGTCSASVVALTGVEGWFVAREDFRALVASRDPQALALQRAIVQTLAARLRALNARIAACPAPEARPATAAPPEGDALAGARRPGFDWRAFLPRLAFFEGFDAETIATVAAGGEALELERGAWLFREGEAARAAYLVVRGAVEVFARAGERERRIAIAGPGELVGYLALLAEAPHGASARVREGACVLALASTAWRALYEGDSVASVRFVQAVARRLLAATARTNRQLARLIAHARLERARGRAEALEDALAGQIVQTPTA